MSIAHNLKSILNTIPQHVTLVAVTKTKSVTAILEAYHAGQRDFGENKIQEMTVKYEQLPKDIHWHMIGHLQSNKVKYMASYVHLIHGIDKFSTLKEIDKQAKKNGRVINCLLQAYIAEEETKFGFSFDEIEVLLESADLKSLKNIKIVGLMGMATFTDNQHQLTKEFNALTSFYQKLQPKYPDFKILSMGMSSDYLIAIQAGSTLIRVGSAIFGER